MYHWVVPVNKVLRGRTYVGLTMVEGEGRGQKIRDTKRKSNPFHINYTKMARSSYFIVPEGEKTGTD